MSVQKTPEVLIVGATNAGFSACCRLVEARPDWKITLVSQDDGLPCDGGLLPDYIEGNVKRNGLFLCGQDFFPAHNVEFIPASALSGIDYVRQRAVLRGNRRLAYDYLIIAGGRKPVLDIPGKSKEGVFVFFGLSDAEDIRQRLSIPGSVVVCGREDDARRLAVFFAASGREVKLLVDDAGGTAPDGQAGNPEVIGGAGIEEIIGEGRELKAVKLTGGKIIEASSVFFCLRGRPCLDFAAGGPVVLDNGRIKVDGSLRAGTGNIFACGEAVSAACADEAHAQGITAADGILEAESGKKEAAV